MIDTNNIVTDLNNVVLRKVNVKPYQYNKMYVDKNLAGDNLLIDQFNERQYIYFMMVMGELKRYYFIYSLDCDFF